MEPNPLDVFLGGEAAGLLEALEQGPGVDVGDLRERGDAERLVPIEFDESLDGLRRGRRR
jgi:hypothetical protein